jgi:hypothetical protein
MPQIPLDTSVEAEYTDGFILSETELKDISPYSEGRNVFYSILNKDPEAEHGPMVRLSTFYQNNRYDIDWANVPSSARPVRFRDGYSILNQNGDTITGWSGMRFGYQYNDENGQNVKNIMEL